MRPRKHFWVIVLLACILSGCATNPTLRWSQARNVLSTTQDSIRTLHERQVIDDEQLVEIDVAVQTGRHALAVAESQLPGGGNEFDDWMAVVDEVLNRLIEIELARLEDNP